MKKYIPKIITIIGWIIIVCSLLRMLTSLSFINFIHPNVLFFVISPFLINFLKILIFLPTLLFSADILIPLYLIISFLCGIGLLKINNIARKIIIISGCFKIIEAIYLTYLLLTPPILKRFLFTSIIHVFITLAVGLLYVLFFIHPKVKEEFGKSNKTKKHITSQSS